MKKRLILALAVTMFVACGKDDDKTPNGPYTPEVVLTNPEAPYILYWDGERMQVGRWGTVTQSNILFSRSGSAVAFTVTSNEDTWDAGDVKFNPTGESYEDYATIPVRIDVTTMDGYISSAYYHSLAHVKTGRGDICKLAGLTKADIDAGVYDNERFRLPTDAENQSYASATFVGTRGEQGYGIRLGEDNSTFLPAAGLRYNTSDTDYVYSEGRYWSSRSRSFLSGYNLTFDTSVTPSYGNSSLLGLTVRCVPQEGGCVPARGEY